MKIKEMTPESRPRERLLKNGPSGLSDSELIAIMLGSGIKGKNITALSREIISKLDKEDYSVDVESLMKINGLGQAKASLLAAALEFSRRIMLDMPLYLSSVSGKCFLISPNPIAPMSASQMA